LKFSEKVCRTGVVTTDYRKRPEISRFARAVPKLTGTGGKNARPAAARLPTGAISNQDRGERRVARLDLAKCTFCGLCAEADKAIRMTNVCECAARHRDRSGDGSQLQPQARCQGTNGSVSTPESKKNRTLNKTAPLVPVSLTFWVGK